MRDFTYKRVIGVVWGIPETIKPILGLPDGDFVLQFKSNGIGEAFVKTSEGMKHHRIGIDVHPPATLNTGDWYAMEMGENRRVTT